jgi:hypothetical protein
MVNGACLVRASDDPAASSWALLKSSRTKAAGCDFSCGAMKMSARRRGHTPTHRTHQLEACHHIQRFIFVAVVAAGLLSCVRADYVEIGAGCCRTSDNGQGTAMDLFAVASQNECASACTSLQGCE